MNREQKIEMFAMRLDGATLQEIGDKFGVTREYVRQTLEKSTQQQSVMKKGKGQIIYPNIATWMFTNNVSTTDLVALLGYKNAPSNQQLVSKRLRGETELRMRDIIGILDVTHLTFEDAFAIKEEPNDTTNN